MKILGRHAFWFLLAIAAAGSASADEKCYTTVNIPAGWTCAQSNSKSADFTNGCYLATAHQEQVEIACPVPQGGWAHPFASDLVQGLDIRKLSCKNAGFGEPTTISGHICQSKNMPNGGGWVYQEEYLSQGQNEQVRRNYYCFASRGTANTVDPSEGDRVTMYACAAKE
jgi:hypothetical protein